MCGRFALAYPRSSLIDWYHAVSMPEIEPRYNISPSDAILVIRDSEQGRVRPPDPSDFKMTPI